MRLASLCSDDYTGDSLHSRESPFGILRGKRKGRIGGGKREEGRKRGGREKGGKNGTGK